MEFLKRRQRRNPNTGEVVFSDEVNIKSPLNHAVKRICGVCNSTWVAGIEMAVKPLLNTLRQSKRKTLSRRQQRDLATWAVLVTMMLEFSDPEKRGIPDGHLKFMFQHHQPPAQTLVWLASAETPPYSLGSRHISFDLRRPRDVVPRGHDSLNNQVTRILFGQLALLVFTSTILPADLEITGKPGDSLRKIWPVIKPLRWPTVPPLTFNDAVLLADGFHESVAPTRSPLTIGV